ncbi:DUF6281 family protein [Streptomyces sp. NPDC058739]|uniref:DUF6281 family protein n=1 Tax=Streptomyces sp. NPDC058739 TaxID=3346618 RepID=UPI0036BD2658
MERTAIGAWSLLLASALAGCVVGGEEVSGEGSCVYLVTFEGRRYVGSAPGDFEVGERLGGAVRAGCDDTGGDPDDPGTPDERVTAYAIEGVDPDLAIVLDPVAPDVVLVASEAGTTLPEELRGVTSEGP